MARYENLSDAELIRKLRAGDTGVMDFLLEKYKFLVRKKANPLFLFGGDTDDLIQEGMIGLFKAIRDYDENAGSFYSFAELCINRQIYTAIESAARKKHGPLNSYVPLSDGEPDREDTYAQPVVPVYMQSPEQLLVDRESVDQFFAKIQNQLSAMEEAVLNYYLEGMNYRQIADKMGKTAKSIDNALQRIRAKVQGLMD